MSTVLKNLEIVLPGSTFNRKKTDILIEKGIISKIGKNLTGKKEIDLLGKKVSIGWFDLRAKSCDPGFEQKEDLNSLINSALKGGITGVGLLPDTSPSVDHKESLDYVKMKSANSLVDIFPYGSVTKKNKGQELTEILDLEQAGAIAFSDGDQPIWHTGILLKALQYLQKVNGVLIDKPYDKYLYKGGQVNEGVNSTLNGLKGLPSIGETLAIKKAIDILEYSGGKYHASCISAVESVKLIKDAKKKGLNITCDIAAHQLAFDDSVSSLFDSNYKVNPPFRTKEDIKSLKKGLIDGTIDCIVSDHTPHEIDCKELEFDLADFGIIGIQTLFSVLNTYSKLDIEVLIEKITSSPRDIIGVDIPQLKEGEKANLTIFDDQEEWILTKEDIVSNSYNSPFIGTELIGKVHAVFNKGQYKEVSKL